MRVNDFLFCEDVRQELGNKVSAMGLFGDDITLNQVSLTNAPVGMRLGFYLRCTLDSTDVVPNRFVLSLRHGATALLEGGGALIVGDATKPIAIATTLPAFVIPGSGELTFEISLYQGDIRVEPPLAKQLAVTVNLPPDT